ncbi:Uncharacterized protein APZ42_024088 [Daphnia magna]|uniref:Uncharacterized protein n=1 Tax=Daphnia magna TaxID=35525 RepID=A0A164UFP3_9CRUS|nr:Uncharacterized protein APZ42_024088 [Daphnia magna]
MAWCRWLKLFNIHHFYLASFLGIALASLIFGSLAGGPVSANGCLVGSILAWRLRV